MIKEGIRCGHKQPGQRSNKCVCVHGLHSVEQKKHFMNVQEAAEESNRMIPISIFMRDECLSSEYYYDGITRC